MHRYAFLVVLLAFLGACSLAPSGVPITGFNPDPEQGKEKLTELADNADAALQMAEATDDKPAAMCLKYVAKQLRVLAGVQDAKPGPFTSFMQIRSTRRMLTNQGDGMLECAALKEDIRRAWIGIGATISGLVF